MYTNNNIKHIFIKDFTKMNDDNIVEELTKIETTNERDEKKIIINELTNSSKQIKKKEKEKKQKN